MQRSFTGNARRSRHVNLSGRNNNSSNTASLFGIQSSSNGTTNALAAAQYERNLRRQDRERLEATRFLQRLWRGHRSRRASQQIWRNEWDAIEYRRVGASWTFDGWLQENTLPEAEQYEDFSIFIQQLRLLLHFHDARYLPDAARLAWFASAFEKTVRNLTAVDMEGEWITKIYSLAELTLRAIWIRRGGTVSPGHLQKPMLQLLVRICGLIPKRMSSLAPRYYTVMAAIAKNMTTKSDGSERDLIVRCVIALLEPITSATIDVYKDFTISFLSVDDLSHHVGHTALSQIATEINYKALASALSTLVHNTCDKHTRLPADPDRRLWILSYFIFFHQHLFGHSASTVQSDGLIFLDIITKLLAKLADVIASRIDVVGEATGGINVHDKIRQPLPALAPFVKNQLLGLTSQQHVTTLLSMIEDAVERQSAMNAVPAPAVGVVAGYSLMLLRAFPRKGDELRMWLVLGSTDPSSTLRLPAIQYFWGASRSTATFQSIFQDSRSALSLIMPQIPKISGPIGDQIPSYRDQDWTVIILFLELYTFVLKFMDDEEFLSGDASLVADETQHASWTKESALSLDSVRSLTIFLKNLAFTLYWNARDLLQGISSQPAGNLQDEFLRTAASARQNIKVLGMSLTYFKGLIAGLLRTIHDRDSRRNFLSEGHWLMIDRFDMDGFIHSVVAEEERRRELQYSDDERNEEDDDERESGFTYPGTPATTDEVEETFDPSEVQQTQRFAVPSQRPTIGSRRKHFEAVAPRLELLRDLPFFIPFATRVQIFRTFIQNDQLRRRRGAVDPDAWRLSLRTAQPGYPSGRATADKHLAIIRRDHVLDDAFDQYYPLGEGLKEPIKIVFVDQFDTEEAGVDGGGVTKEFLMSVTSEAFKSETPLSLFVENDQHLLYPNPNSVEQLKVVLRASGHVERGIEWNERIRDFLKRYEFLGRIVGKCLYEGILVDVNFVGFFLLKWALTGGTQAAQRESSYRANLHDLRDLDEGLYQGLLQLKNYAGDVEDFALNFTITDTVRLPAGTERTTTKELRPDGTNISVTNQNRLVYISYVARHRLQVQPHAQTAAFLQGLGQMIQPAWLSMFNQSELQTLVGGDANNIDIADLRRNTEYGGLYVIGDDGQEHPTIKLFWKVMESMSHDDRRKFLKFVTSTPRAPLLGFGHLNPRFSVRDSSRDQERLPSTSTCVNLLKLPLYTNLETMREKLLYAVSAGAGFDLS